MSDLVASEESTAARARVTYFLGAVVRHKWIVVTTVVFGLLASAGYSYTQPKMYTATATVKLVSQNISPQGTVVPLDATDIATGVQVATSANVSAIVTKKLGKPAPPATSSEIGVTSVIEISVTSNSPEAAAKAANLYAEAYLEYASSTFNGQIDQKQTVLTTQQTNLQNQVNLLEAQLLAAQGKVAQEAAINVQLQNASSELQTVSTAITNLQVAQQQASTGGYILGNATAPTSASSPKTILNLVLGALLGMVVGLAIVFVVDYYDDRVHDREGLNSATDGLPILGEIPRFEDWDRSKQYQVISDERPKSLAAEAYRSLRTSIQFIGLGSEDTKLIQITSPDENDGKTTTAMNLAVAIASSGTTVLLISADLRRPQVHKFLSAENKIGLSSLLTGENTLESVQLKSPAFPNLTILPSGTIPPNPAELLASPGAKAVFESFRKAAEVVIVDSPPILPVTDAVVISEFVDTVVLIVNADKTPGRDVRESLSRLRAVDAPIEGVVLNSVVPSSGRYRYVYRYGYSYHYKSSYYSNDTTEKS